MIDKKTAVIAVVLLVSGLTYFNMEAQKPPRALRPYIKTLRFYNIEAQEGPYPRARGVFSWNLVLLISGMILGTALNYHFRSFKR